MQRFYFPQPLQPLLDVFELRSSDYPELYHQLTRVLRSQPGESYVFFGPAQDASWNELSESDHVFVVKSIDKRSVTFRYGSSIPKPSAEPLKITLFQAIPNKREKIEYLIQKWVEVGIDRFVFFDSERTQRTESFERRMPRLEEIAKEAVEQCGANILPSIHYVQSFRDCFHLVSGTVFVTHTDGNGVGFDGVVSKAKDAASLFVWPEGGFSPSEVEELQKLGATQVSLGNRVLRTETAGVVMAFALRWAKSSHSGQG